MKVRGERECKDCGATWSYYETGSVECPSCGSLRSVGVGERKQHTDAGGELDLSDARQAAADEPLRRAVSVAEDACRHYIQSRGFIAGGELLDLDDIYLAAQELKHAAGTVATRMNLDDEEERYVLSLLRGAEDGERPPASDVPTSVRQARGLASAAAVRSYRLDIREYLDDPDTETPDDGLRLVDRLGDHERRVRALDGDVEPAHADALVEAASAVGRYVQTGTPEARGTAMDALDTLAA